MWPCERTTKQKPDPLPSPTGKFTVWVEHLLVHSGKRCRMKVSGYVLSAVLGAVRVQMVHEVPLESFTPTHRHGTHLVPAKYSACTTCSIRRPLLEGKERATWLRGQSEGESKEQKRALVYENIPWFSFHIWVDSMKRHGTRAGARPWITCRLWRGFVVLGVIAIGLPQHLEALTHSLQLIRRRHQLLSWPKVSKAGHISSRAARFPWWSSG